MIEKEKPDESAVKILGVSFNSPERANLKQIFSSFVSDYIISFVENTKDMLTKLLNSNDQPDIVLIDCQQNKNIFANINDLKRNGVLGIKYFIAVCDEKFDRQEIFVNKFDDYILKPYSAEELISKMHNFRALKKTTFLYNYELNLRKKK